MQMPEKMHVTSKGGVNVSCLIISKISMKSSAPSADEHRCERAGMDAVVAELLEDRRGLHFNFSEPFSP